MPKVSVIIPTYNRGKLITRAIESVFKQTYRDFEIIIIDDGSKDETPNVLAPYLNRIKYIYQENRGISAARNQGIRQASGDYIAFLDSDDEWVEDKLAIQVEILDNNKNIGIVHNKLIILNENGEKVGMKPKKDSGKNFQELVAVGGDLPTSSVITRKECFDKAGLFDEELPTMEDFEMWLRIARSYEVYEVRDICLAYSYRHQQQITKDTIKVYYGLVQMDKKILKTFPDIPVREVVKRLAKNEYMLSRIYFDKGFYRLAFRNLMEALMCDPLVGLSLGEKTDQWTANFIKTFKTYAYFLISAVKSAFSQK
jgi:glycosyltransferase involved in cell wall biosynthesis